MLLGMLFATLTPSASAQDITLTYQTRVLDTVGTPLTATTNVSVSLWQSETSTDEVADRLYTETFSNVSIEDGYVSLVLGQSGGLLATALAAPTWVELDVGSQTLARQPLTSVPQAAHAIHATDADTVDGLHAADFASAVHSHGQASCAWYCVDSPGTLVCPGDRYMAGISFPQLGSSGSPPPQTCSSSTNGDDVAVRCCTVR